MANPSRMKRDIDKAKRDRADEKRERRQRHADSDATAAVAVGAPTVANDELLSRLEQVHEQFDAHKIGFEEFERTKDALLFNRKLWSIFMI